MKGKFKPILLLLLAFVLVFSMTLTGCGKDEKAEDSTKAETTQEASDEDVIPTLSPEEMKEAAELKEKAQEMNTQQDNFYGRWVATSEKAKYLYGNLEITINEDGTFTGNVTDEDFDGVWEKTDKGIRFDSELLSGELFFGDRCKLVIYDEYDTKVTLKKQ